MKPKHGLFAGIVLVALAVGAFLLFGGGDAPAELTLGERAVEVEVVEDHGGPGSELEGTGDGILPPDPLPVVQASNVIGCNIPPRLPIEIADAAVHRLSVAEGSIAGYRVVEDFIGGLANVDAVGRTTAVQGDMFLMSSFNWSSPAPLDGDDDVATTTSTPPNPQLTAVWICVDVASIKSDKGSRDNRFRTAIMDTANFPVATFVAAPLGLYQDSDVPADGPVTLRIPGTLTLVGKEVQVTATVTIQRAEMPYAYELVAQIPVVFSDFGIDNPSNTVVSVRDEGLIEASLTFGWVSLTSG